ncbi:MAG: hypothetical protein K8T25_05585 [Planctomycetia bacterium]|nr:hypothetical protein [Planctomycetia bacterium]
MRFRYLRFRYLSDPLFLACFAIYWVHRWLAAHGLSCELLRAHLNDLICIPFWVPIIVWITRRLSLRKHDAPPDAVEIGVPLVVIAALFEVVLPAQHRWAIPTIADPLDVLSYCAGALGSVCVWRWYYWPATEVAAGQT